MKCWGAHTPSRLLSGALAVTGNGVAAGRMFDRERPLRFCEGAQHHAPGEYAPQQNCIV
jgi:hypothetical protein